MNPGKLILQRCSHQRFVHGQHNHLVIGEQTPIDGRAERKPMKLRTVDALVVHRRELSGVLFGFVLHGVVEDSRRRRHVQPPGGFEELRIVHTDEV